MNRRRGLLLAGMHLALAVAFIGWDVNREWHAGNPPPASRLVLASWQETESSFPFDPCHGHGYVDYFVTPERRSVQWDNLPVWALTGWSIPCPAQWTIAGMLQADTTHYSFGKYLLISVIFCVLIPMQWFLIGAFPLVRRERWFLEPGAVITVCTFISIALILLTRMLQIPNAVEVGSTLLMAFQTLMWLSLCALVIWSSLHGLFRRPRTQPAALP